MSDTKRELIPLCICGQPCKQRPDSSEYYKTCGAPECHKKMRSLSRRENQSLRSSFVGKRQEKYPWGISNPPRSIGVCRICKIKTEKPGNRFCNAHGHLAQRKTRFWEKIKVRET